MPNIGRKCPKKWDIDKVLKELDLEDQTADSDTDWAESEDDASSGTDDCGPTVDALSLAQVSLLNTTSESILNLDQLREPAENETDTSHDIDTHSSCDTIHKITQTQPPRTQGETTSTQASTLLTCTVEKTQATATATSTNTPQQTQATSTAASTNAPFSPPPCTEHTGPTALLPSDSTPMPFFNLIYGEDTYRYIANQTTLYAQQNPPPPSLRWTSVCEEEIKLFMGITLIMGVHQLPELEDYWSGDILLGVPGIVAGMSFKRFKQFVTVCLHLNDNATAAKRREPVFDRMRKVRSLIDIVNTNTQHEYCPHREISIDEAIVGFKGRNSMKQYMPMKPTKRGFKMWNAHDAHNGLTLVIQPYTGSVRGETQGGASIVKSVANFLMDKGHYLFYDNYFSSVELASDLADRGTFTIATTRADRRGWPQQLKDMKTLNKQLQRGEY